MNEQNENIHQRAAQKQQPPRMTPQNELDLQLMTTDPKWGDWNIPDELKEILGETDVFVDENGNQYYDISSLWGLLGFYTRDIRLGNLPYFAGEVGYVENHIDMAGDCLSGLQITKPREQPYNPQLPPKIVKNINFISSFMRIFRPAITKLEVSQSRGGFLRKRHGTLTSEHIQNELEPKKNGLLDKRRIPK